MPLSPTALNRIKRLDIRARMIVRGFMQGLHRSPLQGFSVQFSEHRRYNPGDDPKLLDWLAYAKTDRYYVKRFEAETNLTGYVVMDLSASMGIMPNTRGTHAASDRGVHGGDNSGGGNADTAQFDADTAQFDAGMTKFDYAVCLAAALTYLMTSQKDAVGLVTVADQLRAHLPPRSRRDHLGNMMACLSRLKPAGTTDLDASLTSLAGMLKHHSLVMIFSDLLGGGTIEQTIDRLKSQTAKLKHGGHDVIVFHILDRDEVEFRFRGAIQFEDAETGQTITVDADAFRDEYLAGIERFRESLDRMLGNQKIDYVPLHTGMPFDVALAEYLITRSARG